MKKNQLESKGRYFQEALNVLHRPIYDKISNEYLRDGDEILNLGSGLNFNFEKVIKGEKRVNVTSVDILKPPTVPNFVDKFICKSVDEPFHLKKKYDLITFFELIEHIDHTDILIKNCYDHLKDKGLLIFSFPNLASFLCRFELLFGYQPHVLEVSNVDSNFGGGLIAGLSNTGAVVAHHIRGFTYKAMIEFLKYHKFEIVKTFTTRYKLFNLFPSLATEIIVVCKKQKLKKVTKSKNTLSLKNSQTIKTDYKNFYENYYNNKYSRKLSEAIGEIIKKFAKLKDTRDITLLDSGCGSGFFSDYILNNVISCSKVIGVDIQDWVNNELKKNSNFKFILTDAVKLDLPPESVDIVLSVDVIEHVKNDKKYLDEIARVLKKDGILIVITPNFDRINSIILGGFISDYRHFPKITSVDRVEDKIIKEIHLREYSVDEMSKLLLEIFGNYFQIPFFVGVKLPYFGFRGSYNLKLNSLFGVNKFVDHLFFVCSKDSLLSEQMRQGY